MKKIFLLFVVCIAIPFNRINAQSEIVSQLSKAVTEITGSFMDNPYHHDNSIKIFELSTQFQDAIKDMLRQAPIGSTDWYQLLNMQKIVNCLEHFTAGINNKYPSSIESKELNAFNTIFNGFGWTWKVLCSSEDIILYEYSKDRFKMVLAKNVRPKLDGGDYNAVSYQCYAKSRYTKKEEMFTGRVVFGDNYQFVCCCDDRIPYVKITKVVSKRGIR